MARLLTLVAPGVFSISAWLTIVIGVTEATTGSRTAVTLTSESGPIRVLRSLANGIGSGRQLRMPAFEVMT
jgi:hypothetical protein